MQYIVAYKRRKAILKRLTPLGPTSPSNWQIPYVDHSTGDRWIDEAITGTHGPGIRCLTKLPEPKPDQILEIALNSDFEDEAIVASFKLSNTPKIFPRLLDNAERLIKHEDKLLARRAGLVIQWAATLETTNYNPIVGKSISEINSDWEAVLTISKRAKTLVKQASNVLGETIEKDWSQLQ